MISCCLVVGTRSCMHAQVGVRSHGASPATQEAVGDGFTLLVNMMLQSAHEAARTLIDTIERRGSTLTTWDHFMGQCNNVFELPHLGYEIKNGVAKPRKKWSAELQRGRGGELSCRSKVSLFGDVAAMSVSSTLVVLNRTMRLATPTWRNNLLAGLGAMIHYYNLYDHSKVEFEFLSIAPSTWR